MDSEQAGNTSRGVGAGRGGRDAPWQLAVVGLIWAIFGIALLVVGSGLGASAGPQQEQAQRIGSRIGADVVGGIEQSSTGWITIAVGLLMIVAVLTLASRRGWARQVLVVLGLVAVVDLALTADEQWLTVPAMVLLVLGTIPMLSISLHRYLSGREPEASSGA